MSKSTVNGRVMAPSDERWHAFVAATSEANVFHHPAWSGVLAESYGYRPFVAVVCDDQQQIRAGLPVVEVSSPLTGRRWISLPFTDHCRPLYGDGAGEEATVDLVRYLGDLRQESGIPSLELRTEIPMTEDVYLDDSQVLHVLKLAPDPGKVYDTFHHSQVQRNISKAEKEGIEVRHEVGHDALDTYYALHLNTRQRLGVPVQPKRYFDLLQKRILDAGLGFVLLAYSDETPVAGAVFLNYKTTLTYKYGASDSDHWSLRPNHALFWSAIQWGCENGYTAFDWGKTGTDNEGLRRFKGYWGAEETPLRYSVLDVARHGEGPRPSLSERLSGVMEVVIQKSPKFVCRTLGELLYKHFA